MKKLFLKLIFIFILICSFSNVTFAKSEAVKEIEFKKRKITVQVGDMVTLPVYVKPHNAKVKSVEWYSSNSEVVEVNNSGSIKANNEGTAIITVKTPNNKNASCIVVVKNGSNNFELSGCNNIKVKKSLTIYSSKKVKKWKISNKKIVKKKKSSKKGIKIVGKKKGSVTITAVGVDNKKASCKIKVVKNNTKESKKNNKQKKLQIKNNILYMEVGDVQRIVSSINLNNNTDSTLNYVSGNTNIARVDSNGNVVGVGVGSTTIVVSLGIDSSVYAKCTVNVVNYSGSNLINSIQNMSLQVHNDYKDGHKWKYYNSGTSGSFSTALRKKNRRTNCAKLVSWGLVDIGILKSGQSFYKSGGNEIKYSSSDAKKRMKKYLTYIDANNETAKYLIKHNKLKAGDIVLWAGMQHTNVYAGDKKWYDAGHFTLVNGCKKGVEHCTFKSFGPGENSDLYNHRVWKILRIKN